jgi:hypothetical protein
VGPRDEEELCFVGSHCPASTGSGAGDSMASVLAPTFPGPVAGRPERLPSPQLVDSIGLNPPQRGRVKVGGRTSAVSGLVQPVWAKQLSTISLDAHL